MEIMDESQMNNKIKVLDVFKNEEISENMEILENTEKQQFSNKFEFEKGIIRNAIVSKHKSKFSKVNEKENVKKNCIIFREQCEYCLTNYSISGNLILTKESLLFEPDLRDKNVITNGLGTYQIFIDLYDIYECAHIVVPTKDTYLYNNEETCGFIQVLLKSTYNRICDESSNNNNNNNNNNSNHNNDSNNNSININNEVNKEKSISYYKYISKSLSFVYNLAHPLVQNASFRDYKHDKNKKNDSVGGSSTDISKQGEKIENEENTLTKKKSSSINFNINSKCNIIDHLQDSDLKIYQKINETNYNSNVSPSHPIITYKNNLNLVNSSSFYIEDNSGSNEKKKGDLIHLIDGSEGEEFKENELLKENYDEQIILKNENQLYLEFNANEEYNLNSNENEKSINRKNMEQAQKNALKNVSSKNYNFNETAKDHENKIKRQETSALLYQTQNSSCNNIKNNSFDRQNNDLDYKTNIVSSYSLNDNNHLKENLNNKLRTDIENEINKRSHKKYEEKSFILFRFFNNNKAYETTTKIIKEIDEVRKSENKIKKTITSVPFTSNELLRYIIEQSLKSNESKNVTKSNPLNDNKDQKYQVMAPKLEYINGAVKLLNKEISKQINYYLPPTLSIKIWKLAFCSSIHGVSFKTLYRSVFNKGSVILLVYDMNNVLFGYFLDKLHCDNCYYGSGENFLFTFKNNDTDKKKEKKIKTENENNNNNGIKSIKESCNSTIQAIAEKMFETMEKNDLSLENNKMNKQNNIYEYKNSYDKLSDHLEDTMKELVKEYPNQEIGSSNPNNFLNRINTNTIETSKKSNDSVTNITKEEITNSVSQVNNQNSDNIISSVENNAFNKNNNVNNNNSSIQVYMWTTKNNYFVYSDEKSIMIGGGDNYALVINEDLCKGQTNRSNTYDNDLLTYEEEFEIQFLQLWIFEYY